MTRLQVLELPEGAGDERPPFVLVVDEATETTFRAFDRVSQSTAERIGARMILLFEETVEIPANDVPVGPDGLPLAVRIEGDFEQFREQVQEEIAKAQRGLTQSLSRE